MARVWFLTDQQADALNEMMKKDALNDANSIPSIELRSVMNRYGVSDEDRKVIKSFTWRGKVDFQILMMICDYNLEESFWTNAFMRRTKKFGDKEQFDRTRLLLAKGRAELEERKQKEAA